MFYKGASGSTWARVLETCGKVEVDWESRDIGLCTLECRVLPSNNWSPVLQNVQVPPAVLQVMPGASYSFRAVGRGGHTTIASAVITVPASDDGIGWEAEQFIGRYLELDELGKGRFATVRRARDRGTGQEVALKQTPRHKQSRLSTRAEYDLLASTYHGNIIRAFALFENAPQSGVDTIVIEL